MSVAARPHHWYASYVDGTTLSSMILESIDAKQPMDSCSCSCVMDYSSQMSQKVWILPTPRPFQPKNKVAHLCLLLFLVYWGYNENRELESLNLQILPICWFYFCWKADGVCCLLNFEDFEVVLVCNWC